MDLLIATVLEQIVLYLHVYNEIKKTILTTLFLFWARF